MKRLVFFPCIIVSFLLLHACANLFYIPLTITAYSPSKPVYLPGENPAVWAEFSAPVDPARAEQAFTLSKDKSLMQGRFSWNNNRLSFTPYESFESGYQYVMKVDTSVEDMNGNSLEHEFIFSFRFGQDTTRPFILDMYPTTPFTDCDPYDHQVLGATLPQDRYYPITVTFSEPIDKASLYNAFSVSPNILGTFSWPTDAQVVFTPAEPYDWQTEYEINMGTALKDLEGNALAKNYVSHFFVGSDRTPPQVNSVSSIIPQPARLNETGQDLVENILVNSWESDWNIRVQFSEPVTEQSVRNSFSFTPSWNFRVTYDHLTPDQVILERADDASRFRYGQVYTMTIKSGISDMQENKTTHTFTYMFYVNGVFTKPPSPFQVCFLEDSTSTGPPIIVNELDKITIDDLTPAPSLFDIYFNLAESATIPVTSFAENFTIEIENYCIAKTINSISIIIPIDTPSPPLNDSLSENQVVVRVLVTITDNGDYHGTFTLKIAQKLCDQSLDNQLLHNSMAQEWSRRLRDPD